jgi:hypothetical protein
MKSANSCARRGLEDEAAGGLNLLTQQLSLERAGL